MITEFSPFQSTKFSLIRIQEDQKSHDSKFRRLHLKSFKKLKFTSGQIKKKTFYTE